MADNFDLRKYLVENNLGPFAKAKNLDEREKGDEGPEDIESPLSLKGSRSINTPAEKEKWSGKMADYEKEKALKAVEYPTKPGQGARNKEKMEIWATMERLEKNFNLPLFNMAKNAKDEKHFINIAKKYAEKVGRTVNTENLTKYWKAYSAYKN